MKGIKHDEGKLQYHLFDPRIIRNVVLCLMEGEKKYGKKNYLGLSEERIYDASQRHLNSFYLDRIWLDSESGLPHLAYFISNGVMLYELYEHNQKKKIGTL